jgi:hypothetical protein
VETPDILLISTVHAGRENKRILSLEKGRRERGGMSAASKLHALGDMHVSETVVHHISEEDDCVWTFALRDAPCLAQIRVDEDPGHGPKERTALRERPLVENLWIGDEEDVSRRLSIPKSVKLVKLRGPPRGHVLLPNLAIDTVDRQRQRYRFRAIGRLQSRMFL